MLTLHINIFVVVTVSLLLSWRVECQDVVDQKDAADVEAHCLVNGVKHKIGDSWAGPVGDCTIWKCLRHMETGGLTCPEFQVNPLSGCNITEVDLTVQYPDCCPRAVCPDVPPTFPTLTVTYEKTNGGKDDE